MPEKSHSDSPYCFIVTIVGCKNHTMFYYEWSPKRIKQISNGQPTVTIAAAAMTGILVTISSSIERSMEGSNRVTKAFLQAAIWSHLYAFPDHRTMTLNVLMAMRTRTVTDAAAVVAGQRDCSC